MHSHSDPRCTDLCRQVPECSTVQQLPVLAVPFGQRRPFAEVCLLIDEDHLEVLFLVAQAVAEQSLNL